MLSLLIRDRDRVSWKYMFDVLRRLGVPEIYISYVKALYNNPEFACKINGHITAFFKVTRGVREGCPLSILLYILLAEPLGNAIKFEDRIDGVRIPSVTDLLKVIQFADDTNTFLSNIDSIYPLLEVFRRYHLASGARLKIAKTRGFALNHPAGKHMCPEVPIKWNRLDTKILGVIFTPDLLQSSRLNWTRILNSIGKRVDSLFERELSLRGRSQVLNSLVLSKAWHVGRVFLPDPKNLRCLLRLCFQYIWGKKHEPVRREILHLPLDRGGINFLPFLKQCAALQISDLMHMCADDEPLWCPYAKYWIADRVKDLAPEWRGLANNNRPKHVIGKKPNHYETLMPFFRKG